MIKSTNLIRLIHRLIITSQFNHKSVKALQSLAIKSTFSSYVRHVCVLCVLCVSCGVVCWWGCACGPLLGPVQLTEQGGRMALWLSLLLGVMRKACVGLNGPLWSRRCLSTEHFPCLVRSGPSFQVLRFYGLQCPSPTPRPPILLAQSNQQTSQASTWESARVGLPVTFTFNFHKLIM